LRRLLQRRVPDDKVWVELLRCIPRDIQVVLDLGAAGGEEARFFLEHYPSAEVYCFEPDSRSLPGLQAIEDTRCHAFPIAIGAYDGEASFYLSQSRGANDEWTVSSSLRKPKLHLQNWPEISVRREPVPVECRTLDTWCSEMSIAAIDLLWADIQGAEIDLIDGAKRMLPRTHFFFTEFGDSEFYKGQMGLRAIEARLAGFRRIALCENNVLFANQRWPPAPLLA
jgi:FkbM family methyltransferase